MLALTLPGVSTNRFGFGVGTFSVNGGRGRSNNFLIDGTENNDISVAGQGFQIKNPTRCKRFRCKLPIMTRSSGARAAPWSTSSPSPAAINITARRRGNTIRGATTRSPTRSRSPPRSAIAATRHMELSTSSRALSAARSNCRARPRHRRSGTARTAHFLLRVSEPEAGFEHGRDRVDAHCRRTRHLALAFPGRREPARR